MNKTINGNQGHAIQATDDISCKTLKAREEFICSAEDLYRTLTTKEVIHL